MIYLKTLNGQFARRHREPIQDVTTSRTLDSGKVIHEEFFDAIVGKVIEIGIRKADDSKYSDSFYIIVDDGEDKFNIQTVAEGGYGLDVMNRLYGLNPNLPTELRAWALEADNDKKYYGIALKQGGEKIDRQFGKDEAPSWERHEIGNKVLWDKSPQVKFFIHKLQEKFQEFSMISLPADYSMNGVEVKAASSDEREIKEQFKDKREAPQQQAQTVDQLPRTEDGKKIDANQATSFTNGGDEEDDDLPF